MTIRRATAQDIPALQSLLQDILKVHHQIRPDLFKAEGSKYSDVQLEALLADAKTPVFVYADHSGQILGHLFLQLKELEESSVAYATKNLYIDDLCVSEKARGQQLGQKLYDFALAYAKENGCDRITLNVWNANERAVRFYERQGMAARETKMELKL